MKAAPWWAATAFGLMACMAIGGASAAAASASVPLPPTRPAPVVDVAAFPSVLSDRDARLYRRMFELGEPGRWNEVDRLLEKVEDRRLVGHVLAQRYLHPTKYRTPFRELRDWMEAYHDHPDAPRMYRLAQQRRPAGAGPVQQPTYARGNLASLARETTRQNSDFLDPRGSSGQARRILAQVRQNVRNTRLSVTEEMLARRETRSRLSPEEYGWAHAEVAGGWYYYGNDERALRAAARATESPETAVGMAHWYAGLAAWRMGDLETAARAFSGLSASGDAPGARVAAGAYWAARASLRLGEPEKVSDYLRLAAAYPRTFYGQLSLQALGIERRIHVDDEDVRRAAVDSLEATSAGQRALALLQVGRTERAEDELHGIPGWDDPEMVNALLLVAERGGLTDLAYDVAKRLGDDLPGDWPQAGFNAALFPIPSWQPSSGFQMDRALIFALMRQESGFNPHARSAAGARGLMQIMPATARYIAQRDNLAYSPGALDRPDSNLEFAQRYIAYLLSNGAVEEGLIHLIAAYNGGPGNLIEWLRDLGEEDPLLFIESIPSSETRMFVKRVLSNLWIYRKRLGQPTPSLERIAAGDWPRYESQDDRP